MGGLLNIKGKLLRPQDPGKTHLGVTDMLTYPADTVFWSLDPYSSHHT